MHFNKILDNSALKFKYRHNHPRPGAAAPKWVVYKTAKMAVITTEAATIA